MKSRIMFIMLWSNKYIQLDIFYIPYYSNFELLFLQLILTGKIQEILRYQVYQKMGLHKPYFCHTVYDCYFFIVFMLLLSIYKYLCRNFTSTFGLSDIWKLINTVQKMKKKQVVFIIKIIWLLFVWCWPVFVFYLHLTFDNFGC